MVLNRDIRFIGLTHWILIIENFRLDIYRKESSGWIGECWMSRERMFRVRRFI